MNLSTTSTGSCGTRRQRSRPSSATATTPPKPRQFTSEPRQAFDKHGYLGINIPETHGGGGRAWSGPAIVCEETTAQGCPLLLVSGACGEAISTHDNPERRARWLPGLPGLATGDGKIVFAITEPDACSNTHRVSTTAVCDGDDYLLNGQKYYISGVDEADAILVVARTGTDERTGHAELSRFLIDTDAPGLLAQPLPVSVTLPERSSPSFFDDVRLSDDRLIGAEGDGFRQVFHPGRLARPGQGQDRGRDGGAHDSQVRPAARPRPGRR
jgi:alkylation response protein AidB-like acyl-CoA dehydrogenase